MRISTPAFGASALALTLLALACTSAPDETNRPPSQPPGRNINYALNLPPPMDLAGTAHEAALGFPLASQSPQEFPGLHNVFFLSDNIISGSEPADQASLQALQAMGVKTILSVDGKQPDAEQAAALGMRYVHIPIQYSGVSEGELAEISKTFRELEGPFYVHCFHGKHRGPAAAAIGRIVLDGASRQTAIAEMKQYCGTSDKYEGLYREIAIGPLPSPEETESLDYEFDAIRRPEGMVGVMVQMSRAHDYLVELMERDWAADSDHPDVDALNEASKIMQAFEAAQDLVTVKAGPADMRDWFASSLTESRKLTEALQRRKNGAAEAGGEATASFKALRQTCSDCHKVYRD